MGVIGEKYSDIYRKQFQNGNDNEDSASKFDNFCWWGRIICPFFPTR